MYIEIQHENTDSVNDLQSDTIKFLSLADINVNRSIIARESLQESQKEVLLDQIKGKDARGEEPFLDPITVFSIEDEYHLCEGLHRYEAYREWFKENPELPTEIPTMVIIGSWGDFYVHSAEANINVKPQLGRSRADKIKSVQIFLMEEKYRSLADREIGRILQVDGKTVKKVRQTMEISADGTATFKERKGEVLQFPKTKSQQSEESDRNPPEPEQSAEFRTQNTDYFDEDNQAPKSVVRMEPIPPNRTETERLYEKLEQVEAENRQLKKEVELLQMVTQQRDDYKALAEQQDNVTPFLEEIKKLEGKIGRLEEENEQLKSQPQPEQVQPTTEQPTEQTTFIPLLKQIAEMGIKLAQRMEQTAIASKIEDLIESNFPEEQAKEILAISESEKIVELQQTIDRIQSERQEDKDIVEFKEQELKRAEREAKKFESELKLIKKQMEESGQVGSELAELGGLESIQQKFTELEMVRAKLIETEEKVSNFEKIKSCLKTIGDAVGWSKDDKRSLMSGDSTEAIEKLLSQLNSGMPKDPNKQIHLFKQTNGFKRMMERIFKILPIDQLIAVCNSESAQILAAITDGLQTNQGLIPWSEVASGNVQLEMAF